MKNVKSKNPDPVIEDRTLEDQAKAMANATRTALAKVDDVRVEQVKKTGQAGKNGDTRLAIRAANGQFTKRTTAVAAADAKAAQQFLAEKVKDEAGNELTRKQRIRESLYEAVVTLASNPKGIMGAVRAAEFLNDDAALNVAKETMLQDNDNVVNPIKVVFVSAPNLMHPEPIDGDEEECRRKERDRKSPSFAEVVGVETNPR